MRLITIEVESTKLALSKLGLKLRYNVKFTKFCNHLCYYFYSLNMIWYHKLEMYETSNDRNKKEGVK